MYSSRDKNYFNPSAFLLAKQIYEQVLDNTVWSIFHLCANPDRKDCGAIGAGATN
jgi:hypothetical protein